MLRTGAMLRTAQCAVQGVVLSCQQQEDSRLQCSRQSSHSILPIKAGVVAGNGCRHGPACEALSVGQVQMLSLASPALHLQLYPSD